MRQRYIATVLLSTLVCRRHHLPSAPVQVYVSDTESPGVSVDGSNHTLYALSGSDTPSVITPRPALLTPPRRRGVSLGCMPTLVRDPPPAEFQALLERRRRLGQDRFDEMWDGVLHVNPAPSYEHQRISQQPAVILDPLARAAGLEAVIGGVNIGTADSYRIPDGSLHRPGSGGTFLSTAALALEIVSPDDETWEKLGFYAGRGVAELLIVYPQKRTVDWLGLAGEEYRALDRSGPIDLGPAELAARIDWPA